MPKLVFDKAGERRFEAGVDRGVLYRRDKSTGLYTLGTVWNGLTSVGEKPTGAEATPQYADNIKYLNLVSTEEFAATIEAFTYPDDFMYCDGTMEISTGFAVGQQVRETFGFSYRTKIGTDLNPDAGYKLHLIYGCLAAPSEKTNSTVNDTLEPGTFSWEVTTTPVEIGTVGSVTYRPTAHITLNSMKVAAAKLTAIETILYGTDGTPGTVARLPLPAELITTLAA